MAILAAGMQAATNDTSYDGILPIFETNDYVYIRAEYSGTNVNFIYNPYKVLEIVLKTDSSGNIIDADGNTAAGDTVADIATNGTTPDTATEYPWFYKLQNVSTGKIIESHESALLDIDGVNTVRDSNDWTNPS